MYESVLSALFCVHGSRSIKHQAQQCDLRADGGFRNMLLNLNYGDTRNDAATIVNADG